MTWNEILELKQADVRQLQIGEYINLRPDYANIHNLIDSHGGGLGWDEIMEDFIEEPIEVIQTLYDTKIGFKVFGFRIPNSNRYDTWVTYYVCIASDFNSKNIKPTDKNNWK